MNDVSEILRHPSIIDRLTHWCGVHPDKKAYTFLSDNGAVEAEVTFIELYRKVMSFAHMLSSQGMEGERALLVLPSGMDYVVSFLGCLASGTIAVPLYPPGGKRDWNRLRSVVRDCDPKVLIMNRAVSERYADQFADLLQVADGTHILVDKLDLPVREDRPETDVGPKRIAFLQYTSGSTGNAKGVMVSHENIIHNTRQLATAMGNGINSVDVSWLPLYHDMGMIGKILQSLSVGAHCVFMSSYNFLRNPINWLRAVSDYRGTMVGAPNFSYDMCVDKIKESDIDTLDLSSLRVAYNGSEPVKAATMERFYQRFKRAGFRKDAFFPCYGLAEATLYVAGGPLQGLPLSMEIDRAALSEGRVVTSTLDPDDANYVERVLSCASVDQPFPDQTIRIVDPTTWEVMPDRRVGEIWLKSRSVARGYWNKPAETAETFQAYTTDTGEGPFLRTGDLGFFCEGQLYISGRIKELVIINGVNHYPQDIEETVQSLADHFRIHSGAVFGYDDDRLAVIQGLNRVKATPEDLQEMLAQIRQAVLQVHGIAPAYVALVHPGEIAKTSSGKIQRTFVKRRFLAKELPLLAEWRQESVFDERPSPSVLSMSEGADMAAPEPTEPSRFSALAQQKIDWVQGYFNRRVNSYVIDERRTMPPYIVLDLGNQGLLGMLVAKEQGGLGFTTREFLGVLEALGSKDMTLALFVGLNNALGVRPIAQFATPELKERYLPLLASGRELAAFALTEPGAGSNPQAIQATAQQLPDGSYRLNGTKYWSGSAAWCGVMNVFAKTLDSNGRATGISAFAVPQMSAGLRQGPEALTMGMRGMIQNTVYFEDVEVGPAQILGKPGHGMGVAQDTMCYGRITISAIALGAMKYCYQTMLLYAGGRDISTGRLLDNPYTRFVLTETMHATESVAALLDSIAVSIDAGQGALPEILAVAKCTSTEWAWKSVDRAMQMAGGRGYIESNFIPQMFRDARIFRIFEGPTETLNHFTGSSAIKGRQTIRNYLLAHLDESAVREHYDAVLDQISVRHTGVDGDTAKQHWLYVAVGDYINHLVLYATGCSGTVERSTRQWLLDQMRAAARQLDAAMSQFGDIGSVEALRGFGDRIDRQVGRREQHYPMPNVTPDPYLMPKSGDAAPPARGAAAVPTGSNGAVSGGAARARPVPPSPPASKPVNGAAPVVAASPPRPVQIANYPHDIQAFIGQWIAKRCGRPVDAIGPDMEFAMLGLGSVDSVELSVDLSSKYALDLDPTVFWNYPNIRELAGFVRGELDALEQ